MGADPSDPNPVSPDEAEKLANKRDALYAQHNRQDDDYNRLDHDITNWSTLSAAEKASLDARGIHGKEALQAQADKVANDRDNTWKSYQDAKNAASKAGSGGADRYVR